LTGVFDFDIITLMKKQHGHPKFYKILNDLAELHSNKSHDYANPEDPLFNLRMFGWRGVIVRLGDKFCRLKSFYEKGTFKVKDESIKDTLRDMAIYSILGIILYEDEHQSNSR